MSPGRRRGARFLLIGGGGLVLLAVVLALALRFLLGPESVRRAVQAQASAALGQPVTIEAAGIEVLPRISLELKRIALGAPARVELSRAYVATGLGGLLHRRVEDAELKLTGGRIRLPLPAVTAGGASATTAPVPGSGSGFTIARVRSVEIDDLVIEGGGEKLAVDLEGGLDGDRLKVDSLDLSSGRTKVHGTADLVSWKTLEGSFQLDAKTLDLDGLRRLLSAIAPPPDAKPPPAHAGAAAAAPAFARRVDGKIRASTGWWHGITFRDLVTDLRVEGPSLSLAPMSVKLLGGGYGGSLNLRIQQPANRVTYRGKLQGIDLAEASAALGKKGVATGTLAASLDLAATGATGEALTRSAAGKGEIAVTRLKIKDLDLLGAALAYLGGAGSATRTQDATGALTGHFTVAGARITSDDLFVTSPDFDLRAKGSLGLDGTIAMTADMLLSEAISATASGRDARYLKEGNRLVLPVKLGGSLSQPTATIDAAAIARRAVGVAVEETKKRALDSLTRRLFGRGK